MDNIEIIKKKMLQAGCNKQQCESKVLPIILSILSDSPELLDLAKNLTALKNEIQSQESILNNLRRSEAFERSKIKSAMDDLNEERDEFEAERERFMKEIETSDDPEYVVRIKAATYFKNNVNVTTDYDNYAFIVGLGSILSGKYCSGAEYDYKSANPIPDVFYGGRK